MVDELGKQHEDNILKSIRTNSVEQMQYCKQFEDKIYSEWLQNVKPDLEAQIKEKVKILDEENAKFSVI